MNRKFGESNSFGEHYVGSTYRCLIVTVVGALIAGYFFFAINDKDPRLARAALINQE
jgi:hypothetical protein